MLTFSDQFRIYLIKQRRMVKWSIMIAPRSTDLYMIGEEGFKLLLDNWRNTTGKNVSDYGFDYFIQHKKVGTEDEYVRLSVSGQTSLIREYRFDPNDMVWLGTEYQHQRDNPMPWDIN